MLTKPTAPLYLKVKEELIALIAAGQLSPGDQLPSQRDLVENFNASHMTVRRALDELMHEGIIMAIPGKGIYVRENKLIAETCPAMSFTEEMAMLGMQTSSLVLEVQVIPASTMLARTLDCNAGAPLFYLHRLRLADSIPMAVQTSYLKGWMCPGLLERDLENQSLYRILAEEFHLCLTSSKGSVEAILADEEHARLLGIQTPAALLITEQVNFLEDGLAFEYARTAYRGDRYRLRT